MPTKIDIRKPISTAELVRRWGGIRTLLKKLELDCLLVQNNNMHLGGYVRWLTDVPAEYNHNMTVLFPPDEGMTVLRSTASALPFECFRGVERVLEGAFSPSVSVTGPAEAQLVISYLQERRTKRLGYVGKSLISAGLMGRVREALPELEFVNVSNEVDLLKAIKSEEEMEFLRETVRIQDLAFAALPAIVKPGMYEYEIRSELIRLMMDLGSEEQLIFLGTAEPGRCSGLHTACYVNRQVKSGDYGAILVEVNGPGGFYAESARNFVLGQPFPQLEEDWAVAVKAQRLMQELLVPGMAAGEVVRQYNEYVSQQGYNTEDRLFGHSQGYDLVERPAMMRHYDKGNEEMRIEQGMFMSLHPYFIDETRTIYINDNYYIAEKGAVKLHQTPSEILII